MSILKVAKLGNPVLRKVAKPLEVKQIYSLEIQQLIQNMIETMREYGGVGLAAPQVHESLQIIVIEALDEAQKEENSTSLKVLINPSLTLVSERLIEDWEGCLSIPDLRGLVPRYQEIRVQAYDPGGNAISLQAKDFFARVIQHEHDHLIGKIFLDRMHSFESLSYLKEFSKYRKRNHESRSQKKREKLVGDEFLS